MKERLSSRLAKKEEARNLRRALLFSFLTLALALGLIFLGTPALIKMAIFIGNLRSASVPIETKDTLPPAPPKLKPLPAATNSAQITLEGFAEAGSTVEIFLSGISTKKTITETDGSFLVSNLELTLGRNEIEVQATDKAGNTSQKSNKLVIIYDETPPDLIIKEPVKGASFFTPEKQIEIKGETEPEATVTVNGRFVIVDSEGKFNYPLTLSEGENRIKITATDQAGNQTEEEITINYSN